MSTSSSSAISLLFLSFRIIFGSRVFATFCQLATGALLNRGRQTITGALRTLPLIRKKNYSSYNRFFSQPTWSLMAATRILVRLVLALVPADVSVRLVVDDTTTRRYGPFVYGAGSHRDAVRSSRKHKVFCHGHKWVVIAVLVDLPRTQRSWALPILNLLVLPKDNPKYRKPSDLAKLAMRLLLRWHPERHFVLTGDYGYTAHHLAVALRRHGVVLISRLHEGAKLFEPPPPSSDKRGRPRVKGDRLPAPGERAEAADAAWQRTTIRWYGGEQKDVELLSDTGYWYQSGKPLVHLRWVVVRRPNARLEYFYSTDVTMTPTQIVEHYIGRWSIEVTFEEIRRHHHIEQNEVWCNQSVRRVLPCLFSLFSLTVIWFKEQLKHKRIEPQSDPWYPKTDFTYADAISRLRETLLHETYFSQTQFLPGLAKNPAGRIKALRILASQAI